MLKASHVGTVENKMYLTLILTNMLVSNYFVIKMFETDVFILRTMFVLLTTLSSLPSLFRALGLITFPSTINELMRFLMFNFLINFEIARNVFWIK